MKRVKKNKNKVIIRKMTQKDYDPIIRLWKEGNLPYRPRGRDSNKNFQRQLQQPTSLYFIAQIDNHIIGAVLGTHDGRKGWINRLVVAPSYRKRGIANLLVKEIERQLAARKIDIIACLIEEWNTSSMQVFQQLGYVKHTDILYFSKRKNKYV
ncbi:MAG: GNAT family N-acetyltransferase [Candidatus Thermoplasmatota archaeon]|nr:GNAT family N-acetyltransferase [Candidatus Thermoplasmatota archaeon]